MIKLKKLDRQTPKEKTILGNDVLMTQGTQPPPTTVLWNEKVRKV